MYKSIRLLLSGSRGLRRPFSSSLRVLLRHHLLLQGLSPELCLWIKISSCSAVSKWRCILCHSNNQGRSLTGLNSVITHHISSCRTRTRFIASPINSGCSYSTYFICSQEYCVAEKPNPVFLKTRKESYASTLLCLYNPDPNKLAFSLTQIAFTPEDLLNIYRCQNAFQQ